MDTEFRAPPPPNRGYGFFDSQHYDIEGRLEKNYPGYTAANLQRDVFSDEEETPGFNNSGEGNSWTEDYRGDNSEEIFDGKEINDDVGFYSDGSEVSIDDRVSTPTKETVFNYMFPVRMVVSDSIVVAIFELMVNRIMTLAKRPTT
jgi:hypothetical protein